jgi:hypothetical protein
MSFEIKVSREARQTRVVVTGKPSLGQLSSMMQVLEVDSTDWPRAEVVIDLSELAVRFSPAEQDVLQHIAGRRLSRMERVALRWGNP